ncbi:META domain-containing protein [Reichenbachiella ulvae]|uniref:META domain-containing protein n=1 Tax=Reichenbachiella ulvae TaxID=2980104 RepID=A0ABT3CS02_9BACT|nr:META domain-containing protein [Reichenbachiella ulvae]MCV9386333.1 META domain-containing protein [Reichenbachiella ulvae]
MKGLSNILLLSAILMSCSASKNESSDTFDYRIDHLWINSVQSPCASVGKPSCYQADIVRGNQPERWKTFYHDIIGFRYEPGYVYQLKVRVEFTDSTSSEPDFIRYTLIEEEMKQKDYTLDLNGGWNLTTIDGDSIPDFDSTQIAPNIHFSPESGIVSGSSGCNQFSGSFHLSFINKLKLGSMVSTRRMCPDMQIEQDMLGAFQQIDEFIIKDEKLALQDYNGKVLMTFEKIPEY